MLVYTVVKFADDSELGGKSSIVIQYELDSLEEQAYRKKRLQILRGRVKFLTVVCIRRSRNTGCELEQERFRVDMRRYFFHCQDCEALEQVAQEACAVSNFGDLQDPAR